MSTWLDIITMSLLDAGVTGQGATPSAFDQANALQRLNWMVSQWRQQRYLVYVLRTIGLTSTGAQSYTVGPGGDYDLDVRPDRLEAAFFRQLTQSQPNQIDYPLELIFSREDYNNIAIKQLSSFPNFIFYESSYPLGRIYPWPVPQSAIYAVHITVKEAIDQVTQDDLATDVDLPAEYMQALYLSLAENIRMAYKLPHDAVLEGMARGARDVLRASNAQIPRLRVPTELTRPGIYNPYSDQIR